MKWALAFPIAVLLFQDGPDIPDLIRKLGDDNFDVREASEKQLVQIGAPALAVLKKSTESTDPEIRVRSRRIVEEIESRLNAGKPGARYDARFGGKRQAVADGGGGKDTEEAVLNALRWLARHQSADGSWEATKHADLCGKNQNFPNEKCSPNPGADSFGPGMTGLALLAFLGGGYTHLSKDTYDGICFGDVVKKGVQNLMRLQDPSGRLTSDEVPKYMYSHLIAALALIEAFGMTSSAMIKDSAQKGVDYAVQAQNPGKGWRYSFKPGDNDSSVTGWGAQVLLAARASELKFSKESLEGVLAWYDEVTEKTYHRTGYVDARIGKVVIPGVNEQYSDHPALTAMAVNTRALITQKLEHPSIRGGADTVIGDLPEWDEKGVKVDFYYWYHATNAVFQFDGPAGPYWKKWNEKIKAAILDKQNKAKGACRHGSWEPVDRWSCEGGRVYTTAMGALILETYYRYPPPPRK